MKHTLTFLTALVLAPLAAVHAAQKSVAARFAVPLARTAPTGDGRLADGEWEDAAALTGLISQFDGVAQPRSATFWIKVDATNLYVAQRSTVAPREWNPQTPPIWFDNRDSSFVIGLAPGRVNRGDEPSHYLLRVNLDGQTQAHEITAKLKGVRLTFPHPAWQVEPVIKHAFNADKTEWTSEVAIPLASMKVDAIQEGEAWGVFFARDYEAADQNAIVASSDWRFGDGRRHYGRAFYNNYRLEKEYARARLADAPAIQLLELGDVAAGKPAPRLAIENGTAQAATLTVRYEVKLAAGQSPQPQSREVKLAPGAREAFAFEPVTLPEGTHSLRITVTDAAGLALLAQEIPCRGGTAAVEPAPDFSFTGYHKGGGLLVPTAELARYGVYTGLGEKELTATPYDPITGDFYARLNTASLPEVHQAVRGQVVIRKAGEATPVVTHPIPDFRADVTERRVRFHLPELTPGVYEATANIYGSDERLLGQARQTFIRFDHAKDLPWLGNNIGVTDKVLPPWTPITRKPNIEGRTLDLSCWGRTYHIGGSGLFTGIDTLAQTGRDQSARDILAGPVRLELVRDGEPVALQPDAALGDVKTADHEASWRGTLTGGGWRIETAVRMEYDGYALHRIRIVPPARDARVSDASDKSDRSDTARIGSIRLVIPLKPEHATHLHAAAGDWFRSAVSSIALKGDGVLWHSGQSHGLGVKPHTEKWGRRMTAGNFKPYVWIGGPNRGLAFMADNDQGWVPDGTKKVPAIEVVRDGGQVNLVLNLVARPFAFTKPREVAFSLQATPIRSLASDSRQRLEQLHLTTAFPGFDKDGWCWNGSQFTGLVGGHGSQPYPLDWDRNIRKRKEWERRGHIFTPYQSQLNLMSFGEVDDPRMPPGKQASDVYGYIYPHIAAGCLEHGNLNIARPDLEYRLWCYARWIKDGGLSGMYFDQTEPILGANPPAGCGYILELPDRPNLHGRIQPGYLLTNAREFYKRLRAIFVENGVNDPAIWLHTTDANMISAFAFVGAFLDGENTPYLTPKYPWFSQKYHPERMQAVANPAKWGIGSVWLSMIARSWNWPEARDKQYMTGRSMQGYARLHDYGDQWNYLNWAPFDRAKPMTFFPYWDPAVKAALKTDAPNTLAGAYRQDNRLQVFVFNRTAETREGVQVRVDTAALGLQLPNGQTVNATDLKGWECKQDLPMTWQPEGAAGTLTLTIPPHDFRMILIAPADGAK